MRLIELKSAQNSTDNDDMMVAIACYRDANTGQGLSDGDLTVEITTLLIAGSGTITAGMTSLLWCLSRWPEAYRKAVGKVRAVYKTPGDIGINSLLYKLTYLRACLNEAMRMSPALTTPLYREAGPGGASVCVVYIPEGCEVAVSVYALHHNETYHPDLYTFDPERWLQDKEAVKEMKASWAPFSIGARNCVGKTLAVNAVLIAISTILWHDDFRITEDPLLASIGAGSEELGEKTPRRHRETEFQLYDTFGASTEGPYLHFKRRVLT